MLAGTVGEETGRLGANYFREFLLRRGIFVSRAHAFRTPGVSPTGETVFGPPCHCFLALGSGLRLVGTASARR